MNNTITMNHMTRALNGLLQSCTAENQRKASRRFADSLEKKDMEKAGTADVSDTGVVSRRDMSMEEYKEYIRNRLFGLHLNPSRMMDSISIHISEEGFEAMKNDPEYEAWVLEHLQADFNCYNPWAALCGGSYSVHYIGATREEYHAESWYAGFQGGKGNSLFNEKSEESFWERRMERFEYFQEQFEERQKKKAIAKQWQILKYGKVIAPEEISIAALLLDTISGNVTKK